MCQLKFIILDMFKILIIRSIIFISAPRQQFQYSYGKLNFKMIV